jgi:hypothetical protein
MVRREARCDAHTRRGKSFDLLTNGLPQSHAYDIVPSCVCGSAAI